MSKCQRPQTEGVLLGWDVDLMTELANPNDGGREKLLFYFLTFDTEVSHSLVEWQRIASLAECYSIVVSGMQNMVAPLEQRKE